MGKQRAYRVWQPEEEEALRLGVQKHGLGAWEQIRTDEAFPSLRNRSGVQLKDKWRNLVKFKHLTQAETACLASKSQKAAWKAENFTGFADDCNGGPEFGSGTLPSVAVCCQQEIHATLLAREAHNIQIEANKALAAALAAVERDVEGSEELMRNSVYVATQASEKAMKAKQHVVLARRRLGMALLAAEKDIANDSFMQPVGESLAANASSKREPEISTCSHGGSTPTNPEKNNEANLDHESGSNCKQSSETTSKVTPPQPWSTRKVMCTCGTDMSEGLSLCACKMCGVLAHEDCLVLQATTKGKTFQKPYICMLCKKENEGLPTDVMETHQEAGGDVSVDTTFQSLQSLKRKASSMHSPQESTAGRNPVRASSGADTPTSKIAEELMELLGGDLASKISALQANLEAFPLGKNAPMPQARASETGQPKELDHGANCSPAASMCSALPNKEPAQRAAASHLFASETETEDHNLLDTMLQEITDLSNAELRW